MMISNETEYQEAVARLGEEKKRLEAQKVELEKMNLSAEEVKRVLGDIVKCCVWAMVRRRWTEGLRR